jgi:exopolysaccharide production protein ExoZ
LDEPGLASHAAAPPASGRSALLRGRLDSVQMLRAIAAVSVVAFHIPFFGPIGSWGVTLFFVISGFIMCYVTEKSGSHFLQKRILRIVPLYWAGTLFVFSIAVAAPGLVQNTTGDIGDLVKSLLFIPFYKGQIIQPVLFLGWTLNLEMFFYLLFAFSLKVSHRYRALICSAILLAIAACGHAFRFDSVFLYFYTQPIILDFIFGMICYALIAGITRLQGGPSSFPARLAFTLVGAAFLVAMPLSIGPTPDVTAGITLAALASLSFCFFVYGLAGTSLPRAIVLIGDASYSLYLFHPYVIQLFAKVFKSFRANDTYAHLLGVVAIVLCCVLSVTLYRCVERPVTKYLRKKLIGEGAPSTAPNPSRPDNLPAG